MNSFSRKEILLHVSLAILCVICATIGVMFMDHVTRDFNPYAAEEKLCSDAGGIAVDEAGILHRRYVLCMKPDASIFAVERYKK